MSDVIRVFWLPGCTSCLRTKEFLSAQNVDYEAINVADPEGMADLQKLGALSVPVVAKGDKFVIAQNLVEVVKFLDLNVGTGPQLSPDALVEKYKLILDAAARHVRQFPDDRFEETIPKRNRTCRELSYHVFRIAEALIDATSGKELSLSYFEDPPPKEMRRPAQVVDFGKDVLQRLAVCWESYADRSGRNTVKTYYGDQSLHDVMERCTWHSGQHVRQMVMVLQELFGIQPDRPLTSEDFAGLPMPEKVWE